MNRKIDILNSKFRLFEKFVFLNLKYNLKRRFTPYFEKHLKIPWFSVFLWDEKNI